MATLTLGHAHLLDLKNTSPKFKGSIGNKTSITINEAGLNDEQQQYLPMKSWAQLSIFI